MKILDTKPNRLHGRDAPNASPIECDCGEHFLWERGRGDRVTCPTCKKSEALNFSRRPKTTMSKEEAAAAEVDASSLAEQVAAAQQPPPGHD